MVVLLDFFLFIIIIFLSYLIRIGAIDRQYLQQIYIWIIIYVPIKLYIFSKYKLYRISYRYFSLFELQDVLRASAVSSLILILLGFMSRELDIMSNLPRSVAFIDFLLTFILSFALRFGYRSFYQAEFEQQLGKRVLIVGAGFSGVHLLNELKWPSDRSYSYYPVAFIDDDPCKIGSYIRGLCIIGNRSDIPRIVKEMDIEGIIISMPTSTTSDISEILEYCRESGVDHIRIMPGLSEVISGKVVTGDFKESKMNDFLGRKIVEVEIQNVRSYITGKRVMVTGAGGSIGSELCRQILNYEPELLLMVDNGDTELFYINQELNERDNKSKIVSMLSDVRDFKAIKNLFESHNPQVVFHAAAYKHVPLLETNPREAILNNVEGTMITANLANEFDVDYFVFISTDKAVNPTSVMGATKRVSENLLKQIKSNKTKFVSVRFGNVLDSRGSVIPTFKDQVRKGGPVTVTHPEMTRYFMSIHEAVFLVLQAGALANFGDVFVLDMGEPVKILDLAKNIIRSFGLEPDKDIPIVYTGLRAGEKLYEEVLTAEEGTTLTKSKKIFIAKDNNEYLDNYMDKANEMIRIARINDDYESLILYLKELVPTYKVNPISKVV